MSLQERRLSMLVGCRENEGEREKGKRNDSMTRRKYVSSLRVSRRMHNLKDFFFSVEEVEEEERKRIPFGYLHIYAFCFISTEIFLSILTISRKNSLARYYPHIKFCWSNVRLFFRVYTRSYLRGNQRASIRTRRDPFASRSRDRDIVIFILE